MKTIFITALMLIGTVGHAQTTTTTCESDRIISLTGGSITSCTTSAPAPTLPPAYGGTPWSVILGPSYQSRDERAAVFMDWLTNYRPRRFVLSEYNGRLIGEYLRDHFHSYVSLRNMTYAEKHLRHQLQYERRPHHWFHR